MARMTCRLLAAWACTCVVLNASMSDAFIGGLSGANLVSTPGRVRSCPAVLSLRASSEEPELNSARRNALQLLSAVAVSAIFPDNSFAQAGALDASQGALPVQKSPKREAAPQLSRDTKDMYSGTAPSSARKGQRAQSTNRNKIMVPDSIKKKASGGPAIEFPTSVNDLKSYKTTESGLYYKVLTEGNGTVPTKGQIIEVNYIGTACEADKDGTYDCALPTGEVEIYPSMPQGILKDSPLYDSSFERGRTMKVRYGGAQLCKGLEEALQDMKPGGSKLVFLVPELSFACPKGRVCVADIEVDQRLAFYIELVSVGVAAAPGF